MVANLNQAISYLHYFLAIHFGDHFNKLLWYADKVKEHESKNESAKRRYQLDRLCKSLARNFNFSQQEINAMTDALAQGKDQFDNQLLKVLFARYENSELFTKIDDEFAKLSKEYQKEPFNYPPGNLTNFLKAEFMATLHWEYEESDWSNEWAELGSRFEPPEFEAIPDEFFDPYFNELLDKIKSLYDKYEVEPEFPIYVLKLILTFPYQLIEE